MIDMDRAQAGTALTASAALLAGLCALFGCRVDASGEGGAGGSAGDAEPRLSLPGAAPALPEREPSLEPGTLVSDFSLLDQNPKSETFLEPVSPRDYLDRASGWYFAHAT